MKAIWKRSVVIALAGLLALSTAGCGDGNKKADGGKEADTKDTLKVAAASFADSLEPTVDYNGWQVVRYGIGETLVKFDKKMNVTPWLAEISGAGFFPPDEEQLFWKTEIKRNLTLSQ